MDHATLSSSHSFLPPPTSQVWSLLQRARKPVTPLENRIADSGRLSLTPNSEGNRRKTGSPYNTTSVVTTPEQLQQYLVLPVPPSSS